MPRKITAKQKAFAQEYLRTGKQSQAVMKAYNTTNKKYASSHAVRVLKSKPVKEYMKRLLDKAGMSDDEIARGLKVIKDAGLSKESLSRATPDHALRAMQEASKLKDLYPAEKKHIKQQNVSMNFDNKSSTELMELLSQQQKELEAFNKMIAREQETPLNEIVSGSEVETG